MHIYITGVSSGIGEALANQYLKAGHSVTGIGRGHSIHHPNFSFQSLDLMDVKAVQSFQFDVSQDSLVLINNAGQIGAIQRISEQTESDIEAVMTVNTIAPMLLCQQFLKQVPLTKKQTIVNISSGAANRAIPAWASYCASKIAIDRFSETIDLEEKERGRNLRVFSIAPGVIDTPMQEKIRAASATDFSSHANFVQLKKANDLTTAEQTATKICLLIENASNDCVIQTLKAY
jgi:benzil reductase ((S)-benzoin forming)